MVRTIFDDHCTVEYTIFARQWLRIVLSLLHPRRHDSGANIQHLDLLVPRAGEGILNILQTNQRAPAANSRLILWRKPSLTFNLLFVVLVGIIAYAVIHAATVGIVPQPDRFSELYFTDSSALPKQVAPGSSARFSFSIHNVEGTNKQYPYEVNLIEESSTTVLDEGTRQVAAGSAQEVQVTFDVHPGFTHGEVQVRLLETGQVIDFYLDALSRTNPP